jgi:negative regulator of sigma E activity
MSNDPPNALPADPEALPMDKMEAHLRQQLSAMMDGELASDEARFLFRRLQHDRDLAGCWERWQVCSVLLRGQGTAVLLPSDFSQRVATAVALESPQHAFGGEHALAANGMHPRRWAWWGGGAALAASLALLVVVPRQGSAPAPATGADARVATRSMPASPTAQPSSPRPAHARAPATPPAAVEIASALAVADAPRRAAARRSRAASPAVRREPAPAPAIAPTAADGVLRIAATEPQPLNLPSHRNPFAPQEALPARPWPRAVLPGTGTGAFTANYSTGSTGAFYPFEPRNLAQPEPQAAAGEQPEQP